MLSACCASTGRSSRPTNESLSITAISGAQSGRRNILSPPEAFPSLPWVPASRPVVSSSTRCAQTSSCPMISTRMKNAVTPKSSPTNGIGSNKPSTLRAHSASPCWLFGAAISLPVIAVLPEPVRVPVSWPGGISRWGIGTSSISGW